MTEFLPGWYRSLPNNIYHASEGVSSSILKKFLTQTPAKIYYDKLHDEHKQTDAMILGTVTHSLVLEPENFDQDFFVMPELKLTTKAGRLERDRLLENNKNKTVIKKDIFETAKKMSDAVLSHPTAAKLLKGCIVEQSIYWEYNDEIIHKCRPDALKPGVPIIIDLKTTADASYSFFSKEIVKRNYHLSAAMYLEGCNDNDDLKKCIGVDKFKNFIFICVENTPPYQVAIYSLSDSFLRHGVDLYDTAGYLYKLAQCADDWPTYTHEIREIEPPKWQSVAEIL